MPKGCDWDMYDSKNKMSPVSDKELKANSAPVKHNNNSTNNLIPRDNFMQQPVLSPNNLSKQ